MDNESVQRRQISITVDVKCSAIVYTYYRGITEYACGAGPVCGLIEPLAACGLLPYVCLILQAGRAVTNQRDLASPRCSSESHHHHSRQQYRRYHPILPKHLDGHSFPISRIDGLAPPLPIMKPVVSAMHAWSWYVLTPHPK